MTTAISQHSRMMPGLLGRGEFDTVWRSFFDQPHVFFNQTTKGYPPTDVFTDADGSTIVEVALAGFSRDQITIDVKPEERRLTIRSSSNSESENEQRRIARRSFEKSYVNYDDNLDLKATTATFKDGLLRVTIPTRPEIEPISITID